MDQLPLSHTDWYVEGFRKKNNVDFGPYCTIRIWLAPKIEISIKIYINIDPFNYYSLSFMLLSLSTCFVIGPIKSTVYSVSFIKPPTSLFFSPATTSRLFNA